jgi:hypothetical protein
MIVGSAGDTGSRSGVDLYVKIVGELAQMHGFSKFKLAYFYSDVDREFLRAKLKDEHGVQGLDGRPTLTETDLDKTDHIVAMVGVHPYIKALDMGAEVIIGGRSSDSVIFAAPAIRAGFPEALCYYLGKVLECASFCAEPYAAKESVIGTITDKDIKVTAVAPFQRCTVASVAAHAMYERANPFYEFVAGGMLDMTKCFYQQYDEKTTKITGPKFVPVSGKTKVKLEGSGKVGERYIGIAAVRDPCIIANIEQVIAWARSQVEEQFGTQGYHLFYPIFRKKIELINNV